MRSVLLKEVKACRYCRHAVVQAPEGSNEWVHLRVGAGVSSARYCSRSTRAIPLAKPMLGRRKR